ncbi:methyltransferase domain-containing protein [Candidatus Uhrbacteria bacterium]|nr:methyltransferase domain-containing protein [Candidatus Uhrbacteria bacterium]
MPTLEHSEGKIHIKEEQDGTLSISVKASSPKQFIRTSACHTHYPLPLIKTIVKIKGASYLCDEILRDEDPYYIEQHIVTTLFSFVRPSAFKGKRLLDFGCGSGASTMILARHLPDTEVVGVELEKKNLDVARMRAEYYGYKHISFFQSPSGEELPPDLGTFDFIFMPAVYEHLLPAERSRLSEQLWKLLKKGGVLFVDETPHRWFPIETHTTGLPFINYLPKPLAGMYARHGSRRNLRKDDWDTLLRKGLRGSTSREVLGQIRRFGGKPELLKPLSEGPNTPVDIWYEGYARNAHGRTGKAKRALKGILKAFYTVTRIPLVPYISLAIKKNG